MFMRLSILRCWMGLDAEGTRILGYSSSSVTVYGLGSPAFIYTIAFCPIVINKISAYRELRGGGL